jgi:hypothetical protein
LGVNSTLPRGRIGDHDPLPTSAVSVLSRQGLRHPLIHKQPHPHGVPSETGRRCRRRRTPELISPGTHSSPFSLLPCRTVSQSPIPSHHGTKPIISKREITFASSCVLDQGPCHHKKKIFSSYVLASTIPTSIKQFSDRLYAQDSASSYSYTSFKSIDEPAKPGLWETLARKAKGILDEDGLVHKFEDLRRELPRTNPSSSSGDQVRHSFRKGLSFL